MQRVDPFIPVSPRRRPIARPVAVAAVEPARPANRPAGGIDGFVHPRAASLPTPPVQPVAAQVAAPVVVMSAPVPAPTPRPTKVRRRYSWRSVLETVALVAVVLLAGTLAQTLLAGEILIAAYAIYALVRRVASRTTFLLVLLSLVLIMVLKAMGKDQLLASNFAVYSLLLAFVGVVTLAREVRRSKA